MASSQSKQYDLVVLGATGYTGKLCSEYIASSLPANLKWAIAGRSDSKLSAVAKELKALNGDRVQPGIEIATLVPHDLEALVLKTCLLINTVGPYYLYGSPVLEACAKNGTHYLDVTGESPWVLEMIEKCHGVAKANHAIVIPEIGIESAPSDLLAFALTQFIRKELGVGTREIITSMHDLHGMPSGGTLATVFGVVDKYGLRGVAAAGRPWALSPVPGPKPTTQPSLISRLLGVRSVPNIGILANSPSAGPNVAIVQRSWGLQDRGKLYGPNFTYHEYVTARNQLVGIALQVLFALGSLAIAIAPLRWLAKRLLSVPGQGPTKQASSKEYLEYRAIATADIDGRHPKRAIARFRWNGGLYLFTGICLAEAAMVILNDPELEKRIGGGILTPALLGEPFIDRMKRAGMIFEVEMMPDK